MKGIEKLSPQQQLDYVKNTQLSELELHDIILNLASRSTVLAETVEILYNKLGLMRDPDADPKYENENYLRHVVIHPSASPELLTRAYDDFSQRVERDGGYQTFGVHKVKKIYYAFTQNENSPVELIEDILNGFAHSRGKEVTQQFEWIIWNNLSYLRAKAIQAGIDPELPTDWLQEVLAPTLVKPRMVNVQHTAIGLPDDVMFEPQG